MTETVGLRKKLLKLIAKRWVIMCHKQEAKSNEDIWNSLQRVLNNSRLLKLLKSNRYS